MEIYLHGQLGVEKRTMRAVIDRHCNLERHQKHILWKVRDWQDLNALL
jgi:hypothetical protein